MPIEQPLENPIQKPKPLYNEEGQINDPDIAEEMAYSEAKSREDENWKKLPDEEKQKTEWKAERVGKIFQDEKEIGYARNEILKKMVDSLTQDEKEMLKKLLLEDGKRNFSEIGDFLFEMLEK